MITYLACIKCLISINHPWLQFSSKTKDWNRNRCSSWSSYWKYLQIHEFGPFLSQEPSSFWCVNVSSYQVRKMIPPLMFNSHANQCIIKIPSASSCHAQSTDGIKHLQIHKSRRSLITLWVKLNEKQECECNFDSQKTKFNNIVIASH